MADSLRDDDGVSNPSFNTHLTQLVDDAIARQPSRRALLKTGLGLAAVPFLGGLAACGGGDSPAVAPTPGTPAEQLLGFQSIAISGDDTVTVPTGYVATAFLPWGTPLITGAPNFAVDASNTAAEQEQQVGDNHDGMAFFGFNTAGDGFGSRSDEGLLVFNHEYINPEYFYKPDTDPSNWLLPFTLEKARKGQAAHGASVAHVRRTGAGAWELVRNSQYNRRIHGNTPMSIQGPAAGQPSMQTAADPGGTQVLGMLNNCGNGRTPWGTFLTCEENWHNYFINRDPADYATRVSHKRYGLAKEGTSKNYAWESADPRFDATPYADQLHGGHVHEPHRFGWVVEIDPFDPQAQPIKRTAFGRFGRECAALSLGNDGRMAFYSGDDAKGEYVYKFVPSGRFDAANPRANRDLLDDGTLYVARFDADGSGQWLALVHGQNGLSAENGFASQVEVLLNARAAADKVGATPMDRPEWAAVHPQTREVYVALTNNDGRGDKQPTDKANPRPQNLHGQILRFNEQGGEPTATAFTWELFLLAGEHKGAKSPDGQAVAANLTGTINGDIFSSPDGLAFDRQGRLWIQTDYDDLEAPMQAMGCNQLLCADPSTREVRRFLVGPRGCEITGLAWSPDGKAMWANVQHPGISFPASDGKTRPRSTTVLITKNDGGVIGS